MKWDVSYTRKTTSERGFYSQDDELNSTKALVETSYAYGFVVIMLCRKTPPI